MRSIRTPLAALAVAMLTLACGSPPPSTITLTIKPATGKIPIGKGSFGQLSVGGTMRGDPIPVGTTITLEATAGTFEEGSESLLSEITTTGPTTTVKLFPPSRPGKGTVTATYTDPYGATATKSVDVEFITSSQVVDLRFTCTANTIGAFYTGGDGRTRCDATPIDAEGVPVRNAQVRFLAEAGGFDPLPEDDACSADNPQSCRKLFAYNTKKDKRAPDDVPPEGSPETGEPRWPGPIGRECVRSCNPRDGLATLVAYVEAEGDGLQGTPYVDANDNDKYDAGEVMVPGVTDYEDSQTKYIWKMIKILWTTELEMGSPEARVYELTAPNAPPNYDIDRGGKKSFRAIVLDKHLNPLSANGPTNAVTLSADQGPAQVASTGNRYPRDQWGMDIDPTTFKIRNRTQRASYLRVEPIAIDVANVNDEVDDAGKPKAATYEVSAHINHFTCADENGEPGCTFDSFLSISGTVK